MKSLTLVLFLYSLLFSKSYYSKVEPYEIRDITSNVSGLVTLVDEDLLGKTLTTKSYLNIDDELDKKELYTLKKKIQYLNDMVKSNEGVIKNLEDSLKRKRVNFKRVNALKIKSDVEKDREFYDLVNSENQFLNTQKENENLKVQITDLQLRIAQVQKSIKDKNLSADGFVLYNINVKVGQTVGIATPLAQIADISKAKLIIYIDFEDIKDIENKVIYIDNKKTKYKITRLTKIADSKNISKYKAQIIIKAPAIFSKLVKVEIKND